MAERLTERERAILAAAAIGVGQESAARHYGVSSRTVRRAQDAVVGKLGAKSLTHAVALALIDGLLDADLVKRRTLPVWPRVPGSQRLSA